MISVAGDKCHGANAAAAAHPDVAIDTLGGGMRVCSAFPIDFQIPVLPGAAGVPGGPLRHGNLDESRHGCRDPEAMVVSALARGVVEKGFMT